MRNSNSGADPVGGFLARIGGILLLVLGAVFNLAAPIVGVVSGVAFFVGVLGATFTSRSFGDVFLGVWGYFGEKTAINLKPLGTGIWNGLLVAAGVVVGVYAAAVVLFFVGGLLAGLVWPHWAVLGQEVTGVEPRIVRGLRVGYFHWTGAWWRGWLATNAAAAEGRRLGEWKELRNISGVTYGLAVVPVWCLGAGLWVGSALAAAVHLAVLLAIVVAGTVLLWPRAVLAACLRLCENACRDVRECRVCRGWTAEPVWRCPGCGAAHRGIAPSAKFGLFWWRCSCGTRLPTLSFLGRKRLAEECPKCGGGLERVGKRPVGVAFLGGPTRLWQAAVVALAGGAGRNEGWRTRVPEAEETRLATLWADQGSPDGMDDPVGLLVRRGAGLWRCVRLHGHSGRPVQTPADLVRQRHWGHVGTVVFWVDTASIDAAEKVCGTWLRVMEREHPGRMRHMSCAVALTQSGTTASATWPGAGAEDTDCRECLNHIGGGGNLLNGLDRLFRKVRVFAMEEGRTDAFDALWNWTLETAFSAKVPRSIRPQGGWCRDALAVLVLGGALVWGGWWLWTQWQAGAFPAWGGGWNIDTWPVRQ